MKIIHFLRRSITNTGIFAPSLFSCFLKSKKATKANGNLGLISFRKMMKFFGAFQTKLLLKVSVRILLGNPSNSKFKLSRPTNNSEKLLIIPLKFSTKKTSWLVNHLIDFISSWYPDASVIASITHPWCQWATTSITGVKMRKQSIIQLKVNMLCSKIVWVVLLKKVNKFSSPTVAKAT